MDIEWRLALEAVLTAHQGVQANAARALGVSRATVNRWKKGQGTPDFGECLALAELSRCSPSAVLSSAGHDPDRLRAIRENDVPPAAPLSVQQRTLAANYERWMAVMGPRMGEHEAHLAYWDQHVRNSSMMVAAVEAALNTVPGPPDSTAVNEPGVTAVNDAVSGQKPPRRKRKGNDETPLINRHRLEDMVAAVLATVAPPSNKLLAV